MRVDPDRSIPVFTNPWANERGRAGPFFLSLGFHLLIVTAVFTENYLRPPLELHVTPEQLLAEGRYELTWPVLPKDLPPVQPVEQPKPAPQPRTGDGAKPRFRLPQQVVADDPDAASRRQMIWDQAPKVELSQDVRSPNFVEPQLPAVQRLRFEAAAGQPKAPARQALTPDQAPRVDAAAPRESAPDALRAPRLRYWTTPETQQAAPSKAALASETAPQVAVAPSATDLALLDSGPKVRYWTSETSPQAPQRRTLADEPAPAVSAGRAQGLDIGEIQQPSRLRYWTPQQGTDQPGKRALEPGQAPGIQTAPAAGLDVEQFQRLSRLRYQQAQEASGTSGQVPSRGALATAAEGSPNLGPAGAAAATGDTADLIQAQALASLGELAPPGATEPGRAVVGIDPDANAPAPPRGSRAGSFTAGPDGGASAAGNGTGESGGGDPATLAAVRIPNLSVTPAAPGAPSGLSDVRTPEPGSAANAPNTDRETLLSRFREADFQPAPTVGVLAADALPNPDFPFPGRAVYTLAVNMPNVNSYSGSWIIEFAEAKSVEAASEELSPPLPRVKVDPVYARAAIDERIEGDVVLHAMIRSDGLVDHIKILKRLDSRLDESARVALSKWRFHPATRRGVPIDIETVVRIPFRLVPLDDKKR